MKTWEFLLLVIVGIAISSMAMADSFTTQTGQGYYTWNSQVISYYSFQPDYTFNLVNGVTATDTVGNPTEPINEQALNSYICTQNNNCK
jgi:UDP-N-acetylglucosamine 2-epimerase